MKAPWIDYFAAYAAAATSLGTVLLAIATFRLAKRTNDLAESGDATARTAEQELGQIIEQGKAIADQAKAAMAQAEAMTAQSEASTAQLEVIRQQAESAARQSEAAERALQASIRPVIVGVPYGTILRAPPNPQARIRAAGTGERVESSEHDASYIFWEVRDDRSFLSLRVQNAGPGVARLVRAAITHDRDLTPPTSVRTELTDVVAPAQLGVLHFATEQEASGREGSMRHLLESGENLRIEVSYTDVSGEQLAATTFVLRQRDDGVYRLIKVLPLIEPDMTSQP